MPFLLDVGYLFVLILLSPWLLWKALTTGKYRRGLAAKFLGPRFAWSNPPRGIVWFHGVSVGEIHLLRHVITAFRRRNPDRICVISTTTDTGLDEARKAFPDLTIFWFPLDFSWTVQRTLTRLMPDVLVLAEGELWPNLLMAARQRGVPVAVINARMSPRSLGRYQWLGLLARPLVRSLDLIAVQTDDYAAAFRTLGADPSKVRVTGNVKFDGVSGDRNNERTTKLRRLFNVKEDELILVAGSTQAPEEEIAIDLFRRLRSEFPTLRLFVVPRQKDRFGEVARLLKSSGLPFTLRSSLDSNADLRVADSELILVDTIGELGALWGLADVAFVGGSLDGKRGGQNMIEPAAYGAAVIFGPHVWNFRDTARRLLDAQAAFQVDDAAGLERVIRDLFADVAARRRLGDAARVFVKQQQGATERTIDLLEKLIAPHARESQAA
jgi:3-deoxy-D-manno-octulosonic-acid transferase